MKKINNQKGFSAPLILVFIIVAVLIGGAGWYVYNHRSKQSTTNPTNISDNTDVQDDSSGKDPAGVIKMGSFKSNLYSP